MKIYKFGFLRLFWVIPILTFFWGCQSKKPLTSIPVVETRIQIIPLDGPIAAARAEISGMAWFGDHLILLPQYPDRLGDSLFFIPKQTILDYLSGKKTNAIVPQPIQLKGKTFQDLPGYEGFESLTFVGTQVYLTIETRPKKMMGYLVSGTITSDMKVIDLSDTLVELPPQARLKNMSNEAILEFKNSIFTFYEANGATLNPSPVAYRIDLPGNTIEPVPFPNLEYRITDATHPDENGIFWVLNVFFPMQKFSLKPAPDVLESRYGLGPTHAQNRSVERLVAFQVDEHQIKLADQPPIQLEQESSMVTRNWEAVVRLDHLGFLIATDKFPQTIFGFLPFQKNTLLRIGPRWRSVRFLCLFLNGQD